MDNEKLATELLHELKASAKRWFIIAIVELCIIVAIVVGFLWYISLPIDEISTTTIENREGNANYVGGNINGVLNNGENNDKENKEESD